MDHHTRGPRRGGVHCGPGRRLRRPGRAALAAGSSLALLAAPFGPAAVHAPWASGGAGDGGSGIAARPRVASPAGLVSQPSGRHTPAAGGGLGRAGTRPAGPGDPGRARSRFAPFMFGGNLALRHETGKLGHRLAIVRIYSHIGSPFPVEPDQRMMARGSTLLVSMDSDGQSYAAIAAGQYDREIRTFLRSVNHAAFQYHLRAIYISFEHEPDNLLHRALGSPRQFVKAWRHVHGLARAAHLNWRTGGRLHWVLILSRSSYRFSWVSRYWPGRDEVGVIGADGYNSSGCPLVQGTEPTPGSLFDPALSFAAAHGPLPVFIPEWGSDNDPAGTQARFIHRMQKYLVAHTGIVAALYWDAGGPDCNYSVDDHPASLVALGALAAALKH